MLLRHFEGQRGVCGHWETEDSVWTDCEEAELPSLALAASFCLSSVISFSSSLSLLSSWARPRSREKLVEVLSDGELLFKHTTLVPACVGPAALLALIVGPTMLGPTQAEVMAVDL